MRLDLIKAIDAFLDNDDDYRGMTILTLQSAQEILRIYQELESDYAKAHGEFQEATKDFKDRTQEVNEKIEAFYKDEKASLEQAQEVLKLCQEIQDAINTSIASMTDIQANIEENKEQITDLASKTEASEQQAGEYAKEAISARDDFINNTQSAKSDIETLKNQTTNDIDMLKTQTESEIQTAKDDLNTLKTQATTEINNTKNDASTAITDLKTQTTTEVQASKEQVLKALQDALDDFEAQKQNIQSSLDALQNKAQSSNPLVLKEVQGDECIVTVMSPEGAMSYVLPASVDIENVDWSDERSESMQALYPQIKSYGTLLYGQMITNTNNDVAGEIHQQYFGLRKDAAQIAVVSGKEEKPQSTSINLAPESINLVIDDGTGTGNNFFINKDGSIMNSKSIMLASIDMSNNASATMSMNPNAVIISSIIEEKQNNILLNDGIKINSSGDIILSASNILALDPQSKTTKKVLLEGDSTAGSQSSLEDLKWVTYTDNTIPPPPDTPESELKNYHINNTLQFNASKVFFNTMRNPNAELDLSTGDNDINGHITVQPGNIDIHTFDRGDGGSISLTSGVSLSSVSGGIFLESGDSSMALGFGGIRISAVKFTINGRPLNIS